jgi:hypothetical protein
MNAGVDLCWGELGRAPQLNLGAHQYIHIFSGKFVSSGNANRHGGGGVLDGRRRTRLNKRVWPSGVHNLGLRQFCLPWPTCNIQ